MAFSGIELANFGRFFCKCRADSPFCNGHTGVDIVFSFVVCGWHRARGSTDACNIFIITYLRSFSYHQYELDQNVSLFFKYRYFLNILPKLESKSGRIKLQGHYIKATLRNDSGGVIKDRGRRIQHRPSLCAHTIRKKQHSSAYKLSQQQETFGQSKGIRPAL